MRKLPGVRSRGEVGSTGSRPGRLARALGLDIAFGRSLHACAVAARFGVPTVWDAHMLIFLAAMARALAVPLDDQSAGIPTFVGQLRFPSDGVSASGFPRRRGGSSSRITALTSQRRSLKPADLGGEGRPQVGYVGHLYPGKGFEIIRRLATRGSVGGLPCRRRRAEHGGGSSAPIPTLPKNIRLHGFVPPAADRTALPRLRRALAPYQADVRIAGGGETAAWMSPLKVFGYMAAGKAIICSDLPVLREVIEDGRNGLLVAPDDPDAWVAAVPACSRIDLFTKGWLRPHVPISFPAIPGSSGRAVC